MLLNAFPFAGFVLKVLHYSEGIQILFDSHGVLTPAEYTLPLYYYGIRPFLFDRQFLS